MDGIRTAAVVGGSLAGLSAALDLALAGLDVTVFERDQAVLPSFEPPYAGTMVRLHGLLRRLGVPTQARVDDEGVVDARRDARVFQGDPAEVRRFQSEAPAVLLDLSWAGATVRDWVGAAGFSGEFVRDWLAPRLYGWGHAPIRDPFSAPAEAFVRGLRMAGRLDGSNGAAVRIEGGTAALRGRVVAAIEAAGGRVLTGRHVTLVRRPAQGVRLHVVGFGAGAGREVVERDAVVLAVNPTAALGLLADPDTEERALLKAVPSRRGRLVRHTDHRVMPRQRSLWRALMHHADGPGRTRWLNRTGEVEAGAPYTFETWDPDLVLAEDRVTWDRLRTVPVATADGESARAALERRQGALSTWYAGPWLRAPFSAEDAVCSGLAVAADVVTRRRLERPMARACA